MFCGLGAFVKTEMAWSKDGMVGSCELVYSSRWFIEPVKLLLKEKGVKMKAALGDDVHSLLIYHVVILSFALESRTPFQKSSVYYKEGKKCQRCRCMMKKPCQTLTFSSYFFVLLLPWLSISHPLKVKRVHKRRSGKDCEERCYHVEMGIHSKSKSNYPAIQYCLLGNWRLN